MNIKPADRAASAAAAAASGDTTWTPTDGPRRVSVLGATGSIGSSTLDLVSRNKHAFTVVALTANSDAERLAALARHHHAELAVVGDPARYRELAALLAGSGTEVAAGTDALEAAAARPADCVVAAIVGAA